MEDFVYIILIVVWVLVSFLKRKPKKRAPAGESKPARQKDTSGKPEEVSMEEMLEEFFGGGKKKKEQQKPAEVQYDKREERRTREDLREQERWDARGKEDYSRYDRQSEEPAYQDHSGTDSVADDHEFASEGKVQTIDDLIESHKREEAIRLASEQMLGDEHAHEGIPEFDLRKAVIFSEILNRKYH